MLRLDAQVLCEERPAPHTPLRASSLEVVDEQVLAETVRTRVERPPLVDAGHALDEGPQARAVVEHERVDGDPAPGDALDLAQRLLRGPHADPAERQRPLAVQPAAREVRRRLAVGDHDDVLVAARMARQQLGAEPQPVLEIGERVAHVPARLGQVAQLELDGAREEADDGEVVARVPGADQALHRHARPSSPRRSAPPTTSTSSCRGAARWSWWSLWSAAYTSKSSGRGRAASPAARASGLLQRRHQVERERIAEAIRLASRPGAASCRPRLSVA